MKNLPVLKSETVIQPSFRRELEQAEHFYNQQHASSTLRSYHSDWTIFEAWCRSHGLPAVPAAPEAIAIFLSSQAADGKRPSTLTRRVAAIRYFHIKAGITDSPTASEIVRSTMKGIRRTLGAAKEQKAPATADRLLKMVAKVPDTLKGSRDRAILLLGFAGAFRRSELAHLLVSDLEEVPAGLRVLIRKSKTDQEGEGQIVPILKGAQACPVEAVRAWLERAKICEGPVFRRFGKGNKIFNVALRSQSIGQIVKKYAGKAGFKPEEYAGHSLRSGFLTSAAMNGASIFKMMDISRHKSVETLRGYVRLADEFKDHAAEGLL
ncbi:MAG: tyrosine-type recombinase/integrase [Desulfarculaceae bacterium]|nr:tyrosine-type recombinase/integrase [Desulfarculaceae bacterium]MCF8118305.1 tyrosine-type recombinase/integrase [Desulfarculaceae bacterium]